MLSRAGHFLAGLPGQVDVVGGGTRGRDPSDLDGGCRPVKGCTAEVVQYMAAVQAGEPEAGTKVIEIVPR
jgi:hypothetical protein